MTLSGMSQLREGGTEELLVAPEFVEGRVREHRKGDHAATFWHLGGGNGITDHRRCRLQTTLPARRAGVAENEAIAVEAGGDEHGARQFQEARPPRRDPEQSV